MANVQISDLPFATIPLVGATTFFEVEATEGGVVVSRRVAADDLVISATTLFINGTSVDDPAIGGGVFDGQLLWRNVNLQQTGVFGFDPAGDNFIWSNDAEGGFHQIAIRDGTVLAETIAAAAGGLLVNNLLTGGGLERVLTIADLFAGGLDALSDVTLTAPATGSVLFKSAGDWLNTPAITIDPAADVKLFQAGAEVFRTLPAANGGAEANNTLTGGGFERVLTTADLFAGAFIGTSTDDPTIFGGTFDGVAAWQNANLLATGAVGFEPAGDAFRVFNKTRGGDIALRVISTTPAEIDVYFYEGSAGQHLWRDNSNNRLMELRAGLNAVTLIAQQNNTPASGASQLGQFRVEISNGGDPSATFGFPESGSPSTILTIKQFVHGGQIRLVAEDNSGSEQITFLGDPDGVSQLYFAGVLNLRTLLAASGGVEVNNTLTGAGLERVLTVGDLFTGGLNALSDVTLTAPATGSVLFKSAGDWLNTPAITIDPAAAIELFHAGVGTPKFRTTANGFDLLGDGATTSDFDFYSLDGATLRASLRTDGAGLRIASQVNSLSVSIFARNGAGAETVGLQVTGSTGITQLYHSGSIKLLTQSQGVTIRGNTATNAQLLIEGSTGVDMFTIAAASTLIIFNSALDGSSIRFTGEDAGSVNRIMLTMDPDNDVQLYRVGLVRVSTRLDGWAIRGLLTNLPASGGTQDVSLHLENQNGVIAGGIRYTTSIDMRIENFVHGGDIFMLAEDAGGTLRSLVLMDPDGPNSIGLHEVGVLVARTATAALGGLFANNTLTGAGFERVLTTADRTDASVYTRNATIVEDRTLLASASATIINNNNVLAALIADLQSADIIQ